MRLAGDYEIEAAIGSYQWHDIVTDYIYQKAESSKPTL